MSNKNKLSSLVKEKRKKIIPWYKKAWSAIKNLPHSLYMPSKRSFIFVLLLVGVSFVLSHYLLALLHPIRLFCLENVPQISTNLSQLLQSIGNVCFRFLTSGKLAQSDNHFQNLISIHAGIGTIIFALVIFVAESLRDRNDKYEGRVLLQESFLYPLAVGEILVFFIFIWGDVYFTSVLPVILIGLLSIRSLGNVIKIHLNRYLFKQKRIKVMVERLQQSINLEVDKRIGQNILLDKLDGKNIKLKFELFRLHHQSEYYCFKADKTGIISDINLDKLIKFADIVEKKARENDFIYNKDEVLTGKIVASEQTSEPSEAKATKSILNTKRYISARYKGSVEEGDGLIYIGKDLLDTSKDKDVTKLKDKDVTVKLKETFNEIFTIKEDDNFTIEMRYELSSTKDDFIEAIINKQPGKIEEVSEIYNKLAEGFLEYMQKYGLIYSSEQAGQERNSISGGWKQITWLSSDIRDIFYKAIESDDKDIIEDVTYLVISIARIGIKYRDQYIFQEFIGFVEILYSEAYKKENKDLKSLMIDRTWRNLKETVDFFIIPSLNSGEIESSDANILKDFVIYLYKILQNLLKQAFDNGDFDSFKNFKNTALNLVKYLDIGSYGGNNSLKQINKEIIGRKNQMLFGVASWILYRFLEENENSCKFYEEIKSVLPNTIEGLTELFMVVHSLDVIGYWFWGRWEIPDEGCVCISPERKLEVFYAVKALSILESKTENEIEAITLAYNRDLASMAEEDSYLLKALDSISKNKEKWKVVLSNEAMKKVSDFKKLLQKVKNSQEECDKNLKIKTKISQEKVNNFKEQFIKRFEEDASLRNIFKHYELFEDKRCEEYDNGGKGCFGINRIDDKAVFFKNWHIHYGRWYHRYANNMAFGETSSIIDKILTKCTDIEEKEFKETLESFENRYDDIIFVIDSIWSEDFLSQRSGNYIEKDDIEDKADEKKLENFMGYYKLKGKNLPVFSVSHKNENSKQILILNKKRLGTLTQYSPLENKRENALKKDIFYMRIEAFSEKNELLNEMTKSPPNWLKEVGDTEKQEEHLKEKVLIEILEKFEYHEHKNFEGYRLELKNTR